jgi:hypothetical protein
MTEPVNGKMVNGHFDCGMKPGLLRADREVFAHSPLTIHHSPDRRAV